MRNDRSPSNGPTYSEKPYEEKRPPYAERQAYAGNPDDEDGPRDAADHDHYVPRTSGTATAPKSRATSRAG